MKKLVILLSVLTLAACLTGCFRGKIPDVSGLSLEEAEKILAEHDLKVSTVEYEYSDFIPEGKVVTTIPLADMKAPPNGKLIIHISVGREHTWAVDSEIKIHYISPESPDNCSYDRPYIERDILYIELFDYVFGDDMSWSGSAITGEASIKSDFETTVPVTAEYEKQSWTKDEPQNFTIQLPVEGLGSERPAELYIKLKIEHKGEQKDLLIDCKFEWQK